MKLVLVICIQAIILYQISDTKDIPPQNEHVKNIELRHDAFEKAEGFSRMLEVYDQNQLRSMSDLWQRIKNAAVNAWNHVKKIAHKTKDKTHAMIKDFKDKMNQIHLKFKQRLNDIKKQMKEIIDQAISISQNVGKCLKEEKNEIDRIAREILRKVTSCISENIWHLLNLNQNLPLDFNENDFQSRLDNNLEACVQDEDIDEDCLYEVRDDVYSEVDGEENEILQNATETRSVAGNLLDTVTFCSTDGLISAAAKMTVEVVKVIKCAKEETEN